MALGPPVATKSSCFAVGFWGARSPSCYVFHTSRQAMIKTYNRETADAHPPGPNQSWQNQSWDSSEHDQKLIKPGKAHNELAHQILDKSGQWFVCKCTDTAWSIRDQGMTGIQWSMTKTWIRPERPMLRWPTKFELNLISGLSANAQKLPHQSETR